MFSYSESTSGNCSWAATANPASLFQTSGTGSSLDLRRGTRWSHVIIVKKWCTDCFVFLIPSESIPVEYLQMSGSSILSETEGFNFDISRFYIMMIFVIELESLSRIPVSCIVHSIESLRNRMENQWIVNQTDSLPPQRFTSTATTQTRTWRDIFRITVTNKEWVGWLKVRFLLRINK